MVGLLITIYIWFFMIIFTVGYFDIFVILFTFLLPMILAIGILTCVFIKHIKRSLMFIIFGSVLFVFSLGFFIFGLNYIADIGLYFAILIFVISILITAGGILYQLVRANGSAVSKARYNCDNEIFLKKAGKNLLLSGGFSAATSGLLITSYPCFVGITATSAYYSNSSVLLTATSLLFTFLIPIALIIGILTLAFIKQIKKGLTFIIFGAALFVFSLGFILPGFGDIRGIGLCFSIFMFVVSMLIIIGDILYHKVRANESDDKIKAETK